MSLGAAKTVTFILTRDPAAALAFYRDLLGLAHAGHDGFADVFDMPGATLRITEIPGHAAGQHPVLGWQVSDIAATVTLLAAKGVTMTIYPGMGMDAQGIWTAPDGKARVSFFADPDGNVLSLTQA